MARREHNYLAKVEAELRGIERLARSYAADDMDVTPTEMREVMICARRALRALGHDFPHIIGDVPSSIPTEG